MATAAPTTAKLLAIITQLQEQVNALQNAAPAATAAPPAGAAPVVFTKMPQMLGANDLIMRKLGHRPGGYGNAVEDYWPWPGRSLMRAHPYLSWLSNIKALKLVKAVAGLEK